MLAMIMASTMPLLAKDQYVDSVFGDTIDRTAEDFVTVSLLVTDPGTYLYSVLGHACLRMQCPTFGLDYCFTYESESVKNRVGDFLAGKLMMGLMNLPVATYCYQYAELSRGVYEYKLNLPPQVEQNLWRILDEQMLKGVTLPYDYYHRGCATMCVQMINRALGNIKIKYNFDFVQSKSVKEIWNENTKEALWVRFLCYFIGGGSELEQPLYGHRSLIVPTDLVTAWQKATINGKPLMASEPNVLVEGKSQAKNGWFTPLIAMLLVLVLSIANLFWNKPYFDWLMLAAQTIVGAFMMYLICFSDLCCTSWNWLIIPFNILPAIFWCWRKYWALPYACALLIWCGVMTYVAIWGHVLVDWPHIVLVLAWTLVLIKQSLARTRQ